MTHFAAAARKGGRLIAIVHPKFGNDPALSGN
jgi:hypothetical protein